MRMVYSSAIQFLVEKLQYDLKYYYKIKKHNIIF